LRRKSKTLPNATRGTKGIGQLWVESEQYGAAVKAAGTGGSFHQSKELALKAFNDGNL